MTDRLRRFVFDELDARGAIVQLHKTCAAIQNTHHYPPALAVLLNQFAVAVCLLRDSIKGDCGVTLQLRGQGAISLIMADCMADRRVRAIAEYSAEALPAVDVIDLMQLDADAVMAITITPTDGERYQGVVPIESTNLEACLEDYFARSEQLPTWFRLFANESQATGIAIHALPPQKVLNAADTSEHFTRLHTLLSTLQDQEALSLSNEQILTRLYHDEQCRLFAPQAIEFGCECTAQRSLDAIASLGPQEVATLIAEHQADGDTSITVDCHFCFQRYSFSLAEIEALLTP